MYYCVEGGAKGLNALSEFISGNTLPSDQWSIIRQKNKHEENTLCVEREWECESVSVYEREREREREITISLKNKYIPVLNPI